MVGTSGEMPNYSLRCDRCGALFAPEIQEERAWDGGVNTFLRCPNGHRYDVAHLAPQAFPLRAKLAALDRQLARTKSEAARDRLMEQRDAVKRRYQRYVKRPKASNRPPSATP